MIVMADVMADAIAAAAAAGRAINNSSAVATRRHASGPHACAAQRADKRTKGTGADGSAMGAQILRERAALDALRQCELLPLSRPQTH